MFINNIIVLLPCLMQLLQCQNVTNEELDYYENLVTEGIVDALNYKLPENAEEYYSPDYDSFGKGCKNFDYIVVGAGSAGAVVASRLSESENVRVLLLEAGEFENNFIDIPGMAFYAQGSQYNWNHNTVPQTTACLGNVDRKCMYPRGRGFGGTTLINGLVYARGNKLDFDAWQRAGNAGWSYADVLPYFLKSENASFPGDDDGFHSMCGPLHVEQSPYESEYMKLFLQANRELGYSILDYNGRNELGASKAQFNTFFGRRFTAADAFLTPSVKQRTNLVLSSNSFVTKISINAETKTAYGVVYMQNGEKRLMNATKEVILAAGAISSPQILMLSGVGPRQQLENLNIDVIADLPVGNHLLDHPCFYGLNILSNLSLSEQTLREYLDEYLHGTGIFTLPGNNEGVGFYRVDNAAHGLPDYELMLIPPNRTSSYFQKGFGYSNETLDALFADVDITSTFTIYLDALHPKSVGTIRLKSANPFEYPLIDPNMLSDSEDHDIEILYEAIQNVLRMLDTDAFRKINATLGKVVLPACDDFLYLSREYWFCTIRQLTSTLYHPVGTCKMGNNPRHGAVVDHELRVHGINHLRVADASIMPTTLSGHPNAPCTMIGERAADFIKNA